MQNSENNRGVCSLALQSVGVWQIGRPHNIHDIDLDRVRRGVTYLMLTNQILVMEYLYRHMEIAVLIPYSFLLNLG